MKYTNEWGDKQDFGLDEPMTVVVKKSDLLKASVIKDGETTRPLSRQEKKELDNALKDITDTSKDWQAAFALFMFFGWPLIWIFIAHFVFHFQNLMNIKECLQELIIIIAGVLIAEMIYGIISHVQEDLMPAEKKEAKPKTKKVTKKKEAEVIIEPTDKKSIEEIEKELHDKLFPEQEPKEDKDIEFLREAIAERDRSPEETADVEFLEAISTASEPEALAALQASQEEEQLKQFEAKQKEIEAQFAKAAKKKKKLKPFKLDLSGDLLERWDAMIDGMRASMLSRPGISAVEKAMLSAMQITPEIALTYLLTLHDEEIERQHEVRHAMLMPHDGRPQPSAEQQEAMLRSIEKQRPQATTSNNPSSLLADPNKMAPRLPPMSMYGKGGVTVNGQELSENDFYRMVQSQKPKQIPKKRAYER